MDIVIMEEIPISAAKKIAEEYGYDQVVIYARKVGEDPNPYGEHMTTYGVDEVHCGVAASIGKTLRKFMGWSPLEDGKFYEMVELEVASLYDVIAEAFDDPNVYDLLDDEIVVDFFRRLPPDIKHFAYHWGTGDTEVRDEIFTYIRENFDGTPGWLLRRTSE